MKLRKKICLSFWIRLVNGKTSIELSKLRWKMLSSMPKRCQLNQERGIEKREHREKKYLWTNGHKVWSKLNSVEKWSLAIWPCPGAAWVTALLPARVNTKAVYNTRERLLLRADISWLQFLLLLLLLLELWDCDMMVRKPGKLDVVVVFQTRPGSARLACTTVLYSAELSEPRGTGGHCLPRFR